MWAFSFWIESSDFSIFFFKAMVLSSYLVLLLVTLGLYVSDGRLRFGDRWPLSSSSSLYNSSSSFTALISFSRSTAWPEVDGPGNMLPSLSVSRSSAWQLISFIRPNTRITCSNHGDLKLLKKIVENPTPNRIYLTFTQHFFRSVKYKCNKCQRYDSLI